MVRIDFRFPTQRDLVVYDKEGSEPLLQGARERGFNAVSIDTRLQQPNFFGLIGSVLRLVLFRQRLFDGYVDSMLWLLRPKVVVTIIDNDFRFWKLMARHRNIVTIAIQNGIRDKNDPVFSPDSHVSGSGVTHLFAFNKSIGSAFSSVARVEYLHPHGSFRNNRIVKLGVERQGAGWISQYRRESNWADKTLSHAEFYQREADAVRAFFKWAKSRGLPFYVLGSQPATTTHEEVQWFSSVLGIKELICLPKIDLQTSYQRVDKMQIVATVSSTLGYEALARGAKCMFFSSAAKRGTAPSWIFGWPMSFEKLPEFVCTSTSEKDIESGLDHLMRSKESPYMSGLFMEWDPGNSEFWRVVSEELNATRSS